MSKGGRGRRDRQLDVRHGPFSPVHRSASMPIPESNTLAALGSDARQRGPVPGVCILCEKTEPLLLSHILPKWSYRWHKSEGGVLHWNPNSRYSSFMQDGYKHYLMCSECEQYLGDAERAIGGLTNSSRAQFRRYGLAVDLIDSDCVEISGENRRLIQRGLCGIALKAHYSPSSVQRIIGKRILSRLRVAILSDDYSMCSAPVGIKWFNGTFEDANPRAYAGVGISSDENGSTRSIISMGGVDWFIQIGGNISPQYGYDWKIMLGSLEARALWFDEWDDFEATLPDDLWGVEDGDNCLCGSGDEFGTCCKNVWVLSP